MFEYFNYINFLIHIYIYHGLIKGYSNVTLLTKFVHMFYILITYIYINTNQLEIMVDCQLMRNYFKNKIK